MSNSKKVFPDAKAALDGLLSDQVALRAAATSARKHAERHLSWDAHLDAFETAAKRSQARQS